MRWTTFRKASACVPTRSATRWSSSSGKGFEMFNAMLDAIREESVGYLFNLKLEVQENPIVEETPIAASGQAAVPNLIVGGAQAGAQGGAAGRGGGAAGPRGSGAATRRAGAAAEGSGARGARSTAGGGSAGADRHWCRRSATAVRLSRRV